MGTTPLHLIALDDVGEVVRQMFNNRRAFVDKTVGVCGDILTIRDIAATLTRVLTPKVFADKPVSKRVSKACATTACSECAR